MKFVVIDTEMGFPIARLATDSDVSRFMATFGPGAGTLRVEHSVT